MSVKIVMTKLEERRENLRGHNKRAHPTGSDF